MTPFIAQRTQNWRTKHPSKRNRRLVKRCQQQPERRRLANENRRCQMQAEIRLP